MSIVRSFSAAALLGAAVTAPASADIAGFNFFNPAQWTYNQADSGTPPQFTNANTVDFTTGGGNSRSVWFNNKQDITSFTASFTYHMANYVGSGSSFTQGLTFAIQNAGLNAVGSNGQGLGYNGITSSAAVTIQLVGDSATYTGFYTGGVVGSGSTNTAPVNAFNGQDIDVSIAYNGSILTVQMTQGSLIAPPKNYFVGSLASVVGGGMAYVGFTGGTVNGARQTISNFQFTSVPGPGGIAVLALGAVARRRRSH